jgi:N utilization substance protein A
VVGQLLASEGFRNVEEVAYVDVNDLAGIEGFDLETAEEIQSRAREYLARIEAEYQDKRKALGVADELAEVAGVTSAMLVAFGENDIKTVEDLAGCATDDLIGWSEKKGGETVHIPGFLANIAISREEAEAIVVAARVKAGWIDEPPAPEPEEAEGEAEGDADASGSTA